MTPQVNSTSSASSSQLVPYNALHESAPQIGQSWPASSGRTPSAGIIGGLNSTKAITVEIGGPSSPQNAVNQLATTNLEPSFPRIIGPNQMVRPISGAIDGHAEDTAIVTTTKIIADKSNGLLPEENGAARTEQELALSIPELWRSFQQCSETVMSCRGRWNETKAQRADAKSKLAAVLSDYKTLLSRLGRNGQWANFLKENKIPLSTADRMVETHRWADPTAIPDVACEKLHELTSDQIDALVLKLAPSLRKKLTTSQATERFLMELAKAIEPPLAALLVAA